MEPNAPTPRPDSNAGPNADPNADPKADPAAYAAPGRGVRLRRRPPVGAAPGTIARPEQAAPTHIRVTSYDADRIRDEEFTCEEDCSLPDSIEGWPAVWVDVTGFADLDRLRQVGEQLGLHLLHLEDAVHVHQRPKVEPDDDHLFVVLRCAPPRAPTGSAMHTEQVALYLSGQVLLTIREQASPMFDPVRQRLQRSGSRIRSFGTDYLLYAITDTVVDGFFPVMDELGERVLALETRLLSGEDQVDGSELHRARQAVSAMRRLLWQYRESLYSLQRDQILPISDETRRYLRDTLDHCLQLLESANHLRETIAGLTDVHTAQSGQRMNEVMKVLTVISTVFIPLSFLAGLYGMNFVHMPELGSRWGYPVLLMIMVAIALAMLTWFWRRGWIGAARP